MRPHWFLGYSGRSLPSVILALLVLWHQSRMLGWIGGILVPFLPLFCMLTLSLVWGSHWFLGFSPPSFWVSLWWFCLLPPPIHLLACSKLVQSLTWCCFPRNTFLACVLWIVSHYCLWFVTVLWSSKWCCGIWTTWCFLLQCCLLPPLLLGTFGFLMQAATAQQYLFPIMQRVLG